MTQDSPANAGSPPAPAGSGRPQEIPAAELAAGLLVLAALLGLGRFVYTPILPVMAAALGLTKAQAGLIGSANYAGYLAGALAAMHPRVARHRRAWLIGALVLGPATLVAMSLVATVPAFVALRFLNGMAGALGFVIATTTVLGRLAATGREALAPLHYAGVGTGISLAVLAVTLAPAWRASWAASAVLAGALGLPAVALLRRTAAAPAPRPVGHDVATGPYARLVAAYGLFGFGYVVTATFLAAIVRGAPALASKVDAVWLVVGVAAIPSVALWSAVQRVLRFRRTFALACLVEASGVLASVGNGGTLGVFFAAAALGATFVALTALGLHGALRLRGAHPQRTVAAMMVAFGTGQILGPVVAGVLADMTASFVLPSAAAALALVAAAVLAVSLPPTADEG